MFKNENAYKIILRIAYCIALVFGRDAHVNATKSFSHRSQIITLRGDRPLEKQISKKNAVYIIKYNFILSGNVKIPENSILRFEGGTIGGPFTIIGQNTDVEAECIKIFSKEVCFQGTWVARKSYPEWFGAEGDGICDDAKAIYKACILSSKLILNKKSIYLVNSQTSLNNIFFLIEKDFEICGNNSTIVWGKNAIKEKASTQNVISARLFEFGSTYNRFSNIDINIHDLLFYVELSDMHPNIRHTGGLSIFQLSSLNRFTANNVKIETKGANNKLTILNNYGYANEIYLDNIYGDLSSASLEGAPIWVMSLSKKVLLSVKNSFFECDTADEMISLTLLNNSNYHDREITANFINTKMVNSSQFDNGYMFIVSNYQKSNNNFIKIGIVNSEIVSKGKAALPLIDVQNYAGKYKDIYLNAKNSVFRFVEKESGSCKGLYRTQDNTPLTVNYDSCIFLAPDRFVLPNNQKGQGHFCFRNSTISSKYFASRSTNLCEGADYLFDGCTFINESDSAYFLSMDTNTWFNNCNVSGNVKGLLGRNQNLFPINNVYDNVVINGVVQNTSIKNENKIRILTRGEEITDGYVFDPSGQIEIIIYKPDKLIEGKSVIVNGLPVKLVVQSANRNLYSYISPKLFPYYLRIGLNWIMYEDGRAKYLRYFYCKHHDGRNVLLNIKNEIEIY